MEFTLLNLQLSDVSHTIQLAIAPVFLLTGVGTVLSVLINRLARIIDRSRALEDLFNADVQASENSLLSAELNELYDRSHFINRAITLSTTCALLICLVIAALFLGDATGLGLDKIIAALFVLGVLALIGGLIYFIREIFVATKTLDRQREYGRQRHRRTPH